MDSRSNSVSFSFSSEALGDELPKSSEQQNQRTDSLGYLRLRGRAAERERSNKHSKKDKVSGYEGVEDNMLTSVEIQIIIADP